MQDINVEELTIFTIPIRLGKSFLTLIGEQQGHIIIDLFAGTGGTRLGFERGGGKCLNAPRVARAKKTLAREFGGMRENWSCLFTFICAP